MILIKKCLWVRSNIVRKYLLKDTTAAITCIRSQENRGFTTKCHHQNTVFSLQGCFLLPNNNSTQLLHRKWYCKGLLEGDGNEFTKQKELKKVKELFPEARVTLNILSQRTPDKIFDVYYKQHMPGKKATRNIEWTCTYKFTWPEKMKFEAMAISKRVAAEKAATQALHWLYSVGRINKDGRPLYEEKVIEEIRSNFDESIQAEISQRSVALINNIWDEYEAEIKQIYEIAAEKAKQKAIETPLLLTKDSTIDNEDEYAEEKDDALPLQSEARGPTDPVYGRQLSPPSLAALKRREAALSSSFEYYKENITPLPVDQYADEITSTLEDNRVCVIVGAAGCGKSTRVPAALLRHCRLDGKIIVSEPRRVAAIGLAERVASELGEDVGCSVGYRVRLQARPPRPPAGSVLYCTSGVLLNRLQANPGLFGCSHVIIDEAHERDVNTDVTMLLLKRAMSLNAELKIAIMSATLDTAVFTQYFDSCPVIEVPGKTFPVEVSYLEDIEKRYQLRLPNIRANCLREDGRPQLNIAEITEVIKAIDKHESEGAILVFLPGWAEIKQATQILHAHYRGSTLHLIVPVHSRLSTGDQSRMFSHPGPGVRKIVLATNVAETSVTIPDVVHVVDAGTHRENTLHAAGSASLDTVWVSRAGAAQRSGRAGRVQSGHCYRLYTKEKEAEFVPHTTPEILRIPLEQTVLDCKTYAPDEKAVDFLSQLPQPPSLTAVKYAVNDLIDIGALTLSEQLTRLGSVLSSLPLGPRAGLALVRAATAGAAVAQADTQALVDNNIELFENAPDRRDEIREIKRSFSATSDHAALHCIQREFESQHASAGAGLLWTDRYGLKKDRLVYVKSLSNLYLRELLKSGIIEPNIELEHINRFSNIGELHVATLFSGIGALYCTKRRVKTKGKLKTVNEIFSTTGERAHIASESVNSGLTKTDSKLTLVVSSRGRLSAERRALVLHKTSVISPHAALLFTAGPVTEVENDGNTALLSMVKHKLNIEVPASQSKILLKARQMLWATFNYQIDRDINNLEYDEVTSVIKFKTKLLKAVCRMLVEATRDIKITDIEEIA